MPRWSPDELAEASRLLSAAGRPRQGVYMSESVTSAADWSACTHLPLWVAAYRRNDGHLPQDPPRTGHWPGYHLWQYTDRGQLPGYLGDLDLNTTRGGIPGGGQMVTVQQLREWIPQRPSDASSWHMWCQRLMWNVCEDWGERTATYRSARDARRASVIVSTDPASAPPGAFHYWLWPDDDHVGVSLGGGRVLMTGVGKVGFDEQWATGAGVVDVSRFNRESGLPYVGWAYTNGANSVQIGDDMSTMAEAQIDAVYKALFGANNGPSGAPVPLSWSSIDGSSRQSDIGVLELLSTPVRRGDGSVPQIQEIADSKTLGLSANAKLDELLDRGPVELSDAQIDRIAEKIAAKAPGASAQDLASAFREALRQMLS